MESWSSAAPSRKLVERFSNPFSSTSPEPPSFLTAHPPSQVRPSSSARCSRGESLPDYRTPMRGVPQLSPIDTDAKPFPPRAAAFPPLPGQPVRRSPRRLVAPFARPASTSGPPPSAGSPAQPVSVMARSTRSSVSSLHSTRRRVPPLPRGGPGKLFRLAWLTAQTQQVPSSMVSSSVALQHVPQRAAPGRIQLTPSTVKFDTDKLPSILNALETTNNGQKLVLEVSVCQDFPPLAVAI